MWKLFLSWAVVKLGLKSVGWLVFMLPLAFLFKTIGAPILAILGVFAVPLLVIFAILGLPIIVVLVFTMMIVGIIGLVLTVGAALLPVLLPILLVWWIVSWMLGRRKSGAAGGPMTGEVRG